MHRFTSLRSARRGCTPPSGNAYRCSAPRSSATLLRCGAHGIPPTPSQHVSRHGKAAYGLPRHLPCSLGALTVRYSAAPPFRPARLAAVGWPSAPSRVPRSPLRGALHLVAPLAAGAPGHAPRVRPAAALRAAPWRGLTAAPCSCLPALRNKQQQQQQPPTAQSSLRWPSRRSGSVKPPSAPRCCRGSHVRKGRLRRGFAISADGLTLDARAPC